MRNMFILIFLGILGGIISIFSSGNAILSFLLFVSLLILIAFLRNKVVFIAIIIRAAISFLNYYFNLFPFKVISFAYLEILTKATQLMYSGIFHVSIFWNAGISSFLYLMFLFPFSFVFGADRLNFFFINSFLGALTVFNIYRISIRISNKRAAVFAAIVYALSPYVAYMSTVLTRDSFVILITTQLVYHLIEYINKEKINFWVPSTIILLLFLRPESLLIILLSIVILQLIIGTKTHKKKLAIYFGAIALIIFVLLNFSTFIFRHGNFAVDTINDFKNARTHGNTAYLENQQYNNIIDIFIYLPVRFVYFAYSPLPNQLRNVSLLFGFFDSLIMVILSVIIIIYRKMILNNNTCRFLLILLLFGYAISSIIEGNIGAAMRHRLQYSFVLYIIGAVYIEHMYSRWRKGYKVKKCAT